jgi:hypothetical protein
MEDFNAVPHCPYCGRKMQFNKVASTDTLRQYLCGCRGIIFHKNVPKWIAPVELQKKDKSSWRP